MMAHLCSTFFQRAGRDYMRIEGYWLTCDDDVSRPVVDGHVIGQNNIAFYDRFLVDIGADRTVFSAHLARKLGLESETTTESKMVGVMRSFAANLRVLSQSCQTAYEAVGLTKARCFCHRSLSMSGKSTRR